MTNMDSTLVIKDLNNGNSYCQLCSTQLKNKMLTAHINGRKHREAVTKRTKEPTISLMKRKAVTSEMKNLRDEGYIKKHKIEVDGTDTTDGYSPKTPWQIERQSQVEDDLKHMDKTKLIEDLPKGFFDDEKIESRVRETVEKNNKMSSELDKFYKEVEELEQQKEHEQMEMMEVSAIQNDIDLIDEQIERWRAVNELEKKKEAVLEAVTAKFDQQPNFDPIEETDNEIDFDFNAIDWRTKTI